MIGITLSCLISIVLSPFGGLYFRIAFAISGLISIVPYAYMTIKLIKSLNKFTERSLDKDAFDKEIKSIKVQALGYFVGTLTYFVFFMLEFYSVMYPKGQNFDMLVAQGLAYFSGNFGPSFYYLYVHHRIFKETQDDIDDARFSRSIYESFLHLNVFEELPQRQTTTASESNSVLSSTPVPYSSTPAQLSSTQKTYD